MNYLAHIYLSFNQPEITVGNFIADSVIGNRFEPYSDKIIQGIYLHRKIDSFTDAHPVYLDSKRKLASRFGLYSGILMDIIYDYYLAKKFSNYSDIDLQTFSSNTYQTLHSYYDVFPDNAKRFYGYMIDHNVLYNYSTLKGLEVVLTHFNHRIKHRYKLEKAIPIVEKHHDLIEEEFTQFFKELISYCKTEIELLNTLNKPHL